MTGESWPEKAERNSRLAECLSVIWALLNGEQVTHRGRVTVVEAKLYSRPSLSVPLFGAAVTPQTAAFVGGWGDGLLTTGNSVEELEKIIDTFRANGGQGKPVHVQLALSWAQTGDEAHSQALDQWAPVAIAGEVNWDLRQRISTGPGAWSGEPRSTNVYWSVLTRVRISSGLPASAARDFLTNFGAAKRPYTLTKGYQNIAPRCVITRAWPLANLPLPRRRCSALKSMPIFVETPSFAWIPGVALWWDQSAARLSRNSICGRTLPWTRCVALCEWDLPRYQDIVIGTVLVRVTRALGDLSPL